MGFLSVMKRFFVYFLQLVSIGIWLLYFYFKMWDFANAAIKLHALNVQTVSFLLYSVLLFLLPVSLIYSPDHTKEKLFNYLGFAFALVFFIGATGDLITYKFFTDYTFIVGDAIFCNIVLNVPNVYGVLCCYIIAALFIFWGIYFVKNKVAGYLLYLSIFLMNVIPPYVYSFAVMGGYPRQAWIEKAAFIIPMHLCFLISLTIAVTSKGIWQERIS